MFARGVQQRVTKAAPFLSLDADPYPVMLNGQIDWVQDAYTTTSNYPYGQNANTIAVNPSSGLLTSNFNYVRNSVKVLINAYTGKMTFYVTNPNDPIIQTYEKAFPGMFTPASHMSSQLVAHLRYPEDIFAVQATMFGKYHIKQAANFYSAADAWTISPAPGAGSPSAALATTQTVNAVGQVVSTRTAGAEWRPIYPGPQDSGTGANPPSRSSLIGVRWSPRRGGNQIQNLSGFMMAGSMAGSRSLRPAQDVRDCASRQIRSTDPPSSWPQDLGHTERLERDLPPQPERLVRAVGAGPP